MSPHSVAVEVHADSPWWGRACNAPNGHGCAVSPTMPVRRLDRSKRSKVRISGFGDEASRTTARGVALGSKTGPYSPCQRPRLVQAKRPISMPKQWWNSTGLPTRSFPVCDTVRLLMVFYRLRSVDMAGVVTYSVKSGSRVMPQ
jgi:hypothetical protein